MPTSSCRNHFRITIPSIPLNFQDTCCIFQDLCCSCLQEALCKQTFILFLFDIMQLTEIEMLAVTQINPFPLLPCTPPSVWILVNPIILQVLIFSPKLVQQPIVQWELYD